MTATADSACSTAVIKNTLLTEPIDHGYRWIEDITIGLEAERPDTELQLKVSADVRNEKYEIRKSTGNTVRRVSNEKIPCDKTKEIVVELFEYRRKFGVAKRKFQIFSKKIMLRDDELYTEKTYRSDDNRATITLIFAYTPGGELRNQVEKARRITEEQKVVLDKIRHVHRFFQGLEILCETVEDIHPYIKAASTAILSLYKLCDKQKECRDAVRSLVDEMSDLLSNGVERLSGVLRAHSNTKTAFRSIAGVIEEISEFAEEQNKGMAGSLSDALFSKTKIEDLSEKLRRAKGGLNDSITYGLWELALDDHLKNDLKFVPNAYYQRGTGCLPGTRVELLAGVDVWIRDPCAEKMAWVYGYAGSGKSALLSSIARNLEKAYIPFTCFMCKRDDADCSDVQRILPTICYDLTRYYGNYRGIVSNVVKQPEGRSITTGDVATQMELLFGESPSYGIISPNRAHQPRVHVLLIDALDECKDVRARSTLAWHLRDFARRVPWIKVIISSRREPDIVNILGNTTHPIHQIDINSSEWKTPTDIRLFIEMRTKELKIKFSPDELNELNDRASGLFIWVTTVFRYAEKRRRSGIIKDILKSPSYANDKPLASLYTLYQQVLDSAVEDEEDKSLMDIVLGIIFVSSTRQLLSANAIANILFPNESGEDLREKKEWVGNIIKSLSAIVYVEEETNAVRTCHPSVLDYTEGMLTRGLQIIAAKPFSARIEEIHARMFNGCFTIMNRSLRFNICGIEDSFRLNKDIPNLPARITQFISEALQYASLFWFSHLEQSDLEDGAEKVFVFLNSQMTLFWLEVLSLLDAIDRGVVILQDCAFLITDKLDIPNIAIEWERLLLSYGDALKSTPHLYLSALSWLPGRSQLWNVIHDSFSPRLPTILNVPVTWRGEKWSERMGFCASSVAYSANGQLFAAGCDDGSVRFWDARSGKRARISFSTESSVGSIAFSPDQHLLASGHQDNNIRLWDLRAEPIVPRVLEGHTGRINSLVFSSDGKRIASGSWDETIRIWNVQSGTAIGDPFEGHDRNVSSTTFSIDDTRIISGSWDGSVRIWNSESGERIGKPLEGHSDCVNCVDCSRDGKLIATASNDMTVRLWDAETYKQIGDPLTGHTRNVNSVCFSFDSKYVISGSSDSSIRIWNARTHSLVRELKGHSIGITAVAVSPDGRDILSCSWDKTVRVWDVKETVSVNHQSVGMSAGVFCVSYVPGSDLIVFGASDRNLYLWDLHSGVAVGKPLKGHTGAVYALAVSGDGQWVVSGSSDKSLRIWDISTRTTLREPMLGHTDRINSVAISNDNRLVASASGDYTVRLWDVAMCKPLLVFRGHEEYVTFVTFSVDGNHVISSSRDNTVRKWDTHTGVTVGQPLRGHSDWVTAVSASLDGRWIATASDDATILVWSTLTLSVIHVLKGHSTCITSVAFSQDNNFLVSGSMDRTIRIWNVQTGEAVGDPLMGHSDWVYCVVFSPNGLEIASSSEDGTVRIWDTRAHTDLELREKVEADSSQLSEDCIRVRWNASRATMVDKDDAWVRDEERLLLWIPWQYRHDIRVGAKLVITAHAHGPVRLPEVDYQRLFSCSGSRWRDIYTP